MTIRECMDAVLQLLNQYSIAGAIVPLSYDDQADTENRMLNLINAAQSEIAATVKPIEMTYVIDNAARKNLAMARQTRILPESSTTFTVAEGAAQTVGFFVKGDVSVSVGETDYGTFSSEEYTPVGVMLAEPTSEVVLTAGEKGCQIKGLVLYEDALDENEIPYDWDERTNAYILPKNCNYVMQINFVTDKGTYRSNIHKWANDDTLLFPKNENGRLVMSYARYAKRYTADDDKLTTELDNTPDAQEAIPYYAAAVIAQDEHPSVYAALYNIWETKLSRLGYKPARVEAEAVEDVYGF